MRKEFFKTLTKLAKIDKRIWLLTADLLCPGSEEFPRDRFVNCGVAEQNMIGIATGLAIKGKIPFCYSISTFLIFRAYEFIRNDIAYQNLSVRLVGCYGPYEGYGISHNCKTEDILTLKLLPNIIMYDGKELEYKYSEPYPIYFPLPRG